MTTGYKVVCVDDSPCKCCGKPLSLKLNAVYVVLSERHTPRGLFLSVVGGVTSPDNHPFGEGAAAFRFRRLDELKAEALQRQNQTQEKTV